MSDQAVREFRVEFPPADLEDLHARLDRTRWPAALPGAPWARGVPLDYLRELADYWRHSYSFPAAEAEINRWPHVRTSIDGLDLHALHVRSTVPGAVALLLLHGWPGSFVEFLSVIGPLTDPAAHGLDPTVAFHVIVPSLPGYGLSGAPTVPGWGVDRIADAMAALMDRLGYPAYRVHGGDWGSAVARSLGIRDAAHVSAIHVTMLVTPPPPGADLALLTDVERGRLAEAKRFRDELSGYFRLQGTRPQTLSYALTDSPVGQLAWITEKFFDWTDSDTTPEDAVDRDRLLTNVTLYWLTGSAGSSASLYYEEYHSRQPPLPSTTPTAVALFPRDLSLPVRAWAEAVNTITRWTEFDRGGHFAAMEQPDLLVADLRAWAAD